ncbi:hypothetical protein [Marinospirillum insulare]|uniref:Uncharacterized protein n=1 Tax=Marinospirillum insulare TaxID=217169 RepID=A0ABQ5ZTE8_9GAMM|nr:hypothetical protein [Marinospirillum insulare]GLR63429.1 hypothetical protein GCM10007878_08640 [Marinospirillum insulare]
MRIQGPFHTHLPLAPKRRKKSSGPVDNASEDSASSAAGIAKFNPDIDYIAADEQLNFDERELSASARRALRGYWSVAHQGHLWAEWQRIDVYV